MRSLLEKAIVHLLNEDTDAAEALFHQFMVERARQIHSSLRQGENFVLSEGWDDEINKEEYFADDDLSDVADDTDGGMDDMDHGDDMSMGGDDMGDDALGDDTDTMGGDDMGDDSGSMDMGGDTDSKLDDIQDQLEKLTAEFEQMMAELDGDNNTEDFGGENDLGDDTETDDFSGDEEETDGDYSPEGNGTEEPDDEEEPVEEAEEMDEEDLDDITESVIAELEKVCIKNETTDGEEVGDGKKISGNSKSTLTQKKPNMADAKPVVTKNVTHSGFERETSPTVKSMKARKNTVSGKATSTQKSVPKGGDSSALLNKDFANLKANNKSPID